MAGTQGFEPRYADPESAVLPLDDVPAAILILAKPPGDDLDHIGHRRGPRMRAKLRVRGRALLFCAARVSRACAVRPAAARSAGRLWIPVCGIRSARWPQPHPCRCFVRDRKSTRLNS